MESKICLQCGQEYTSRGKKFCSNSCKMRWRNLNDNVAKRPDVRAKIAAHAKESNRQAQLMTPEAREKAIAGISKAIKGRRLSEAHKRAIGAGVKRAGNRPPRNLHLVGINHPNWQGGHSTIRNKAHNSPEYKQFRNAVLVRDNWTCQTCSKRGGKLQVHHVKPWGPFPELRYDPANGITLCRSCHKTAHRGVPRPITVGARTLAAQASNPS